MDERVLIMDHSADSCVGIPLPSTLGSVPEKDSPICENDEKVERQFAVTFMGDFSLEAWCSVIIEDVGLCELSQ